MIKRYNVFGGEDGFDWDYEVDRNGSWCLYDDIKDSLIEWHDLRKNPDDLPPLQCYVFISGRKNRHVSVLLPEGWHFLGNVPTFKIIEWAYIPKPPREEEDGNK